MRIVRELDEFGAIGQVRAEAFHVVREGRRADGEDHVVPRQQRDRHSIIVEEAPSARPVMHVRLPIVESETFYTMDSGGLGYGLPAAVGVALARPGEKVIGLVGDGSSMYVIQALWSAAQLKTPVAFLVLKNRRYAALHEFARIFGFGQGDPVPGTDLPDLDFIGLAAAQGVGGVRVKSAAELRPALQRAFESTQPFLVEIEVA